MEERLHSASPDDLLLDPKNPRLGRHNVRDDLSKDQQSKILELMEDWTLEELAVSFLESGFWHQEALVVVHEKIGKISGRIVVEGNRRLAALKLLWAAKRNPSNSTPRWRTLAESGSQKAFERLRMVPYVEAPSRDDVQAYIGFRHVTGIKEWHPAEKAEFIAHLIDDKKMSYEDVRKKIGSKAPAVRQSYISYRLLLQMEELQDSVSVEAIEDRFSLLYFAIRTEGAQKYLHIDLLASPDHAKRPVPKEHLSSLENFARWLFGDKKQEPMITDSRQISRFNTILLSPKATSYLERTKSPSLEAAYRLAGGDEAEILRLIEQAADNLETALGTTHHFKKSKRIQDAVARLGKDAMQLLDIFPGAKREVNEESDE